MLTAQGRRVRLPNLAEAVGFGDVAVDRQNGVIRNVKILGPKSRNRRTYTEACIKDAVSRGLYEGVPVYCNHALGRDGKPDPYAPRTIEERFGTVRNVRMAGDSARGDLFFDRKHPMAGSVCEHAERGAELGRYGLSHNSDAEGERHRDGSQTVHRLVEVRTVDVVDCPATTDNFLEQRGRAGDDFGDPPDPKRDAKVARAVAQMSGGNGDDEGDEGDQDDGLDGLPEPSARAGGAGDKVLEACEAVIWDYGIDTATKLLKIKTLLGALDAMARVDAEQAAAATEQVLRRCRAAGLGRVATVLERAPRVYQVRAAGRMAVLERQIGKDSRKYREARERTYNRYCRLLYANEQAAGLRGGRPMSTDERRLHDSRRRAERLALTEQARLSPAPKGRKELGAWLRG